MNNRIAIVKVRACSFQQVKWAASVALLFWAIPLNASAINSDYYLGTYIRIQLGGQQQDVDFGVLGYSSVQRSKGGIELGVRWEASRHLINYGVKYRNWSSYVEAIGAAFFSSDAELRGLYWLARDLNLGSFRTNSRLTALGVGFRQNWLRGDLHELAVREGVFALRFSDGTSSLAIKVNNDVKGLLGFGGGTDHGTTARIALVHAQHRVLEQDQLIYVASDFITPRPVLDKVPDNPINSDDGRRPVHWLSTHSPAIFHANFYVGFNGSIVEGLPYVVEVGVDNPKLGAMIQNAVHDNFGLYPRFPWLLRPEEGYFNFYIQPNFLKYALD